MKKTLSVILIALIAISSIFATANHSSNDLKGSVETTLNLSIPASALEYHNIGFTSEESPNYDNPKDLSLINLEYARGGLTKTNIGYVFYDIKAATLPTVTLTAGAGFSSDTEGFTGDTIKYSITVGAESSASGSNEGINLKLNTLTNGVSQGTVGFGITIVEANNVDADFSAASWTDTIKVSITDVA